jgi:hypothetical protein
MTLSRTLSGYGLTTETTMGGYERAIALLKAAKPEKSPLTLLNYV